MKTKKGFTLVELMVVIAIIALLTSIITSSLFGSRAKARDAKRISDIGQLQLTLAIFFDRCKQYPATLTLGANNGCPAGITLQSYTSSIPIAIDGSAYDYTVDTNSYTNYVLHTKLESTNEVIKDSLSNTSKPSFASGFNCYDSTSYPLEYCLGPN